MAINDTFTSCPYCKHHQVKCCHTFFGYYLQCTNCKASGPKFRELQKAIRSWNQLSISIEQIRHHDLLNRMNKMESRVNQLSLDVDLPTSA
jgi:hypothetical protein